MMKSGYHNGILVLTLSQPNRLKMHEKVMRALSQFERDEWARTSVGVRDRVQSVWKSKE